MRKKDTESWGLKKKKKSQLLNLKCYLYMKMCSSKSDYIF